MTIITTEMIDAATVAFNRRVDETVINYDNIYVYARWYDLGGWRAQRYYEKFTLWEYDESYFLVKEEDGYIQSGGGLDSSRIQTYDPNRYGADEDADADSVWYYNDWDEFIQKRCVLVSPKNVDCPYAGALVPPII